MRRLLMLLLFLPTVLAALPPAARPILETAAQAEMFDLAAKLPADAVVRLDSLCGDTGGLFASLCRRELNAHGVPVFDATRLARAHTELLARQDDPAFLNSAPPGDFIPPTHIISGEVHFTDESRLGKHRYRVRLLLDAQELVSGVSVWRCDVEQTARVPVRWWWLPAVFVSSMLLVLGANVLSRGYLGAPALFVALTADVLFLAWFLFA